MQSLFALGGGFLGFLGCCLVYAAGGSVLFAWGGLIVFAGLAAAAALFTDTAILSWAAQRKEDREGPGVGRHATVQPGRILLTVEMADPPPPAEGQEPGSAALLADADVAIEVNPGERRGRVSKYRYGSTDAIAVDVVTVKVPR